MTKTYRPSNGTEGGAFIDFFCHHCAKDAKYHETQEGIYGCPIVSASFAYEASDPQYPHQYWVVDDDGGNSRCTEFVKEPVEEKK